MGNIQLSTHFFSLKLGVNEALKVIRSELTNFAIVVEPPKTTFGKVRAHTLLLRLYTHC